MTETGIIFSAIGQEYIELALRSISSIRLHDDTPITLFTCHSNESLKFEGVRNVKEFNLYDLYKDFFDSNYENVNHLLSRKLKVNSALLCDYEKVLYIDADTIVKSTLSDFFEFDDSNTFFLTQQPILQYETVPGELRSRPVRFSNPVYAKAYNSGVFGVYASNETDKFLNSWLEMLNHRQSANGDVSLWKKYSDQEALHKILGLQKFLCNFKVLDCEIWNATDAIWAQLLKKNKFEKIKILHSKLTSYMNLNHPLISDVPSAFVKDFPGYI